MFQEDEFLHYPSLLSLLDFSEQGSLRCLHLLDQIALRYPHFIHAMLLLEAKHELKMHSFNMSPIPLECLEVLVKAISDWPLH